MELPPFKLEEIFEEYEHEPNMLVLGASDASNLTVKELFDLCGESIEFSSIRLRYSDVRGEIDMRQAVAMSYQPAGISPNQVLITIGASEAILIAILVLVQPGDRVLVCNPAYQPLASVAEGIGAVVERYPYVETSQFSPDIDWLLSRLRNPPAIKLLVINTPHNPTGHAISEASLRQLLQVAGEVETRVLVDEVFHGIWMASTQPVPSALTINQDTVVIGSLSKIYGLSGLRVGWLAGPADTIAAGRRMRHYTTIAPPLIVQDIGAIAVKNRAKILDRTRTIVGQNYWHVKSWLEQHREIFDWVEPQAGLTMLLKLKRQVNTDEFVRELASEKKVFLIPCSTAFGMPEGYLRLGLGTDHHVLISGLERLGDFIATKGRAWAS